MKRKLAHNSEVNRFFIRKKNALRENLLQLMRWANIKGASHLVAEIKDSLKDVNIALKPPSQPVVHRILTGNTLNPKVDTVRIVANFFGISVSVLMGDEPLPNNYIPGSRNANMLAYQRVPILPWEQMYTWPHVELQANIPTLITDIRAGTQGYAVRVDDNSMEPYFFKDAYLILNREITPVSGHFVMVQLGNESRPHFRQLLVEGTDHYLKPLHPEFKVIFLEMPYQFLGVLVQTQWNPPIKNKRAAQVSCNFNYNKKKPLAKTADSYSFLSIVDDRSF